MKKNFISARDSISVYDFMEMCGLKCKKTKNRISHGIMVKKLNLRSELFPEVVKSPRRISFDDIRTEDIVNGKIIIVKDDFSKFLYYENPNPLLEQCLLNELKASAKKNKLKEIRNKLIEEKGFKITANGKIVKNVPDDEIFELDDEVVTCKSNRQRKLVKYKARGFVGK